MLPISKKQNFKLPGYFQRLLKDHKKTILLLPVLIFWLTNIIAQDEPRPDSMKHFQRLDVSYIFGGQIYNNNFIYNPGFAFQASYGIKINQFVGVAAGIGYSALQDERFLPVFCEISGCKKNKTNTPTIHMQIGYAYGWYSGDMQVEGYEFHGGMYIDAGFGRKISLNRDYSVLFHWSYRHQFAHMDYKVFGGQDYTEALNYDMFVISLGIIRNCK
jgi:hypothetical protein